MLCPVGKLKPSGGSSLPAATRNDMSHSDRLMLVLAEASFCAHRASNSRGGQHPGCDVSAS